MATKGKSWRPPEVEAAVASYMRMLTLELAQQRYNKSDHRRALLPQLDDRSNLSIERKHQNISAVLRLLGCHWISGYKPLGNYQQALYDEVVSWLEKHPEFDQLARAAAEQPAATPLVTDFEKFVVDAPTRTTINEEPAAYAFNNISHAQRDYVAREARNASLGLAGEELAVAYERHRLMSFKCTSLADRVEHISKSKGDGAGFDVLSFETSGRERFIEVKTTAFGKQTPFFASRNEVEFAKKFDDQFRLYRLFEFRNAPKLFELPGHLERHCKLNPISFLCRI